MTSLADAALKMARDGDPAVATTAGQTLHAAAAKRGDARALLVANVGTERAEVEIAGAEGPTFALHCVDAMHGTLSGIGDWTGGPLPIPPNGFVPALSGTTIDGMGAAAECRDLGNGLSQE